MEMLLSSHLQVNIINTVRTSYNIYNSLGFIGFCIIYHKEKTIQAHLLLFENFSLGNDQQKEQRADTGKYYPLETTNSEIIRDLMSVAIPSFEKKGLKFVAHNDNSIYNI